jgi:hypothetical protein
LDLLQQSKSINNNKTANMDSLRNINDILDAHFNTYFDDDYLSSYETQDDAIADFEYDFNCYYNSETDCIDFEEIKQLCDFNKVMSICAYVAENYDEYDMTIDTEYFEDKDKILKAYTYFYMVDHHQQEFIQYIEEYDFESNDDAMMIDEEEEELPPAQ